MCTLVDRFRTEIYGYSGAICEVCALVDSFVLKYVGIVAHYVLINEILKGYIRQLGGRRGQLITGHITRNRSYCSVSASALRPRLMAIDVSTPVTFET